MNISRGPGGSNPRYGGEQNRDANSFTGLSFTAPAKEELTDLQSSFAKHANDVGIRIEPEQINGNNASALASAVLHAGGADRPGILSGPVLNWISYIHRLAADIQQRSPRSELPDASGIAAERCFYALGSRNCFSSPVDALCFLREMADQAGIKRVGCFDNEVRPDNAEKVAKAIYQSYHLMYQQGLLGFEANRAGASTFAQREQHLQHVLSAALSIIGSPPPRTAPEPEGVAGMISEKEASAARELHLHCLRTAKDVCVVNAWQAAQALGAMIESFRAVRPALAQIAFDVNSATLTETRATAAAVRDILGGVAGRQWNDLNRLLETKASVPSVRLDQIFSVLEHTLQNAASERSFFGSGILDGLPLSRLAPEAARIYPSRFAEGQAFCDKGSVLVLLGVEEHGGTKTCQCLSAGSIATSYLGVSSFTKWSIVREQESILSDRRPNLMPIELRHEDSTPAMAKALDALLASKAGAALKAAPRGEGPLYPLTALPDYERVARIIALAEGLAAVGQSGKVIAEAYARRAPQLHLQQIGEMQLRLAVDPLSFQLQGEWDRSSDEKGLLSLQVTFAAGRGGPYMLPVTRVTTACSDPSFWESTVMLEQEALAAAHLANLMKAAQKQHAQTVQPGK